MSIRRGNGNLGRTRHKPSVRRDKRPRDREIGTLRPMETKSRATLIESLDLPRVALGPWGSLVYPWWFGTTRLRFKSGRTHSLGVRTSVSRRSLFEWGRGVGAHGGIRGRPKPVRPRQARRGPPLRGVDRDVADHARTLIRDGPERHQPRREEEHEESRRTPAE